MPLQALYPFLGFGIVGGSRKGSERRRRLSAPLAEVSARLYRSTLSDSERRRLSPPLAEVSARPYRSTLSDSERLRKRLLISRPKSSSCSEPFRVAPIKLSPTLGFSVGDTNYTLKSKRDYCTCIATLSLFLLSAFQSWSKTLACSTVIVTVIVRAKEPFDV